MLWVVWVLYYPILSKLPQLATLFKICAKKMFGSKFEHKAPVVPHNLLMTHFASKEIYMLYYECVASNFVFNNLWYFPFFGHLLEILQTYSLCINPVWQSRWCAHIHSSYPTIKKVKSLTKKYFNKYKKIFTLKREEKHHESWKGKNYLKNL